MHKTRNKTQCVRDVLEQVLSYTWRLRSAHRPRFDCTPMKIRFGSTILGRSGRSVDYGDHCTVVAVIEDLPNASGNESGARQGGRGGKRTDGKRETERKREGEVGEIHKGKQLPRGGQKQTQRPPYNTIRKTSPLASYVIRSLPDCLSYSIIIRSQGAKRKAHFSWEALHFCLVPRLVPLGSTWIHNAFNTLFTALSPRSRQGLGSTMRLIHNF